MIKVAIFNTYLNTWGGGERSTYAVASTLGSLGFDVEVVTFEEQAPTAGEIERFFGPGHSGFRVRSIKQGDGTLDDALRSYLADKAIFINHTAGSAFVNPCPLGIYFVMFPFQEGGAWVSSYHHFVCNSEFTRRHTEGRWGLGLSTQVLYPAAEEFAGVAGERASDILAVGRFNWRGHAKNQDALVETFSEFADLLPQGWRLVLLGKLNVLPDNIAAFEELKRRCRRLPIAFEVNVPEQRKRELLGRASIYWHATGVGRQNPQDMEHFGISIVEAMLAGVVPVCYGRGGPREIIEHARSGFLYRDLGELKAYTLALILRPQLQAELRAAARERAGCFTRSAFDKGLGGFVRSVVMA